MLCATVEMSLLIAGGVETRCIRKVAISLGVCGKLQQVFSAAQGFDISGAKAADPRP
jgi:hypothetical protein